jgi:hypothetical protein
MLYQKRPLMSEDINIIVEQAEKLWTIIPSSFYATLKIQEEAYLAFAGMRI